MAAMALSLTGDEPLGGAPLTRTVSLGREYGRPKRTGVERGWSPVATLSSGAVDSVTGILAVATSSGVAAAAEPAPLNCRAASSAANMSLIRSVADASDSTGVSNGFGLAFLRIVHQGRPSPRSLWLVTLDRSPVGTDPVAVVVARGSWAKRCTPSSRMRSKTRAGDVLVTMSADTRMKIENSGMLTQAVAAVVNQFATSQPMTPPAAAMPGIPLDGCGIPPAM